LRSAQLSDCVSQWYADFVNVDQEILFELILAANFMDIKSLLELACAKIASLIKGMTIPEIREYFNIENDFTPEERAKLGIFLAFQYPVEIPGVSNEEFLRIAYNKKRKNENLENVNPIEFFNILQTNLNMSKLNIDFLNRNVNEGFSGGEKKRNEILQMSVLNPKLSILDETDSGLDIDALKDVANGINNFFTKEKSIILITHYQRLLEYVKPDFVHVMHKGEIIKTGNASLAIELENKGYDWIIN
jgi:Fe-S cluster assembly ATP-binding protein